jgi:sugar phosphate isomerase/epimerase
MNKREFLIASSKAALLGTAALVVPSTLSFARAQTSDLFFNISLAQWSLHRTLQKGDLDNLDFAKTAKQDFGISAVEYVNQFFMDKAQDADYLKEMKKRADDHGVKSLLIMVDDEGDLGLLDDNLRKTSVENHYKWIEAAHALGCHSIRINAFGDGNKEEVQQAMIQSLGSLTEFGAKENINVLIENHGNYSSDAAWVGEIMRQVNRDNCGTLPDFGNFCLSKKWGSTQNNDCEKAYDRYKGVAEMMPYAKGVSAKSYAFNAEGNETIIDYQKMLEIVKKAGFTGHVGVEFEGNSAEPKGIMDTKNLLIKAGKAIG